MSKLITSTADFLSRDSAALAGTTFKCPECGRTHSIPIQAMTVGSHLLDNLPYFAAKALNHPPRLACVLFDRAIEPIIQDKVLAPLRSTGLNFTEMTIGVPGRILDSEVSIGDETAARMHPQTDLIIGAGSGVICDLTKWVATRLHLPYLILATAPSMNAYTSITATMTEADVKTSRLLDPAAAILMDNELLASAPMEMIHAGMGDLAARAVCNADWKMASFLNGSNFCSLPYQMTAANEQKFLQSSVEIARREPAALAHLSEAILMSGLSMTVLDGETSPSSGAEHVISHFWDLLTHTRGLPRNLHGAQVGIGTLIMLAFFDIMRSIDIRKIDPLVLRRTRPSVESIVADNNRLYGSAAPLFNEVVHKKRVPDSQFPDHIRRIQSLWEPMWDAVSPYLASLASIRDPLLAAGMPLTLASVNRTPAEAVEALVKGPQYRSRYTLLDLAAELGLLTEISTEVLTRSGVVG